MYRNHSVGVVVPAYNEADTVGDVLTSLPGFVDVIYAVDDASTDETAAVMHDIADSPTAPRVEVCGHETNRGAGAAIVTGYRAARAGGQDLVVTLDADGQMNPGHMDELLDPLVENRADFAKGDRLADNHHRTEMPHFRLLGNVILTGLTSVASGYYTVSDPQNGYTAITAEALAALDLDRVPQTHAYCNDLLVQLNELQAQIVDVPMPAIYGDESSTITYSRFIVTVLQVLTVDTIRRLHPSKGLDSKLATEA